jgi:ubiquinol-cytochrome c reductase cytochrome b subunit
MKVLKQLWIAFDDRSGLSPLLNKVAQFRVPPRTGWAYVFGSATLVTLMLQVLTGITLTTAYIPSTSDAYTSLQYITTQAPFGGMLRGMHFFGASALVLLMGLHMARTLLMGAYKFPRELNWLTGVILLGVTLAMAFTGQLLRWDQNAVWSVVVGAAQAGRFPLIGLDLAHFILAGETVGGATLSHFFAFHVFFIPALVFTFVVFHLYLVKRHGVSEPPQAERLVESQSYRTWYESYLKAEGEPLWPNVAWRHIAFAVGLSVVIVTLAAVVGPPALSKPPDPSIIEVYPKPDWYFLWYYALLALLPKEIEDIVISFAPLVIALALFSVPFFSNRGERSPVRRPWAIIVVLLAFALIGSLSTTGQRAAWTPNFDVPPLPANIVGAANGPIASGAQLFYDRGCVACHRISGYGGTRGPDLTAVGTRRGSAEMAVSILGSGRNMPSYAAYLTPDELNALIAFLLSRKAQ